MLHISLCRADGINPRPDADAVPRNSLRMWRTQVALSRDSGERVRKEADNFE